MENNEKMLSARVPVDIKRLVDSDPRDNQEVVVAALRREFGGTNRAAIQRRIDEKKRMKSNLETERNERQYRIDELDAQIDGLKSQLETIEGKTAVDPMEKYERELTDILEGMDGGMSLYPVPPRIKRLAREQYNDERDVDKVMSDLKERSSGYDIDKEQWGDYA